MRNQRNSTHFCHHQHGSASSFTWEAGADEPGGRRGPGHARQCMSCGASSCDNQDKLEIHSVTAFGSKIVMSRKSCRLLECPRLGCAERIFPFCSEGLGSGDDLGASGTGGRVEDAAAAAEAVIVSVQVHGIYF